MPQLEFATYASQIFWLAVIFGLLYFYLARATLPSIREVLNNRQNRIAGDLQKAESMKAEAEAAQSDFTSAIEEARSKASKTLAEARARAEAEEARRNAKIETNFARQAKEAEQRIAQLRKDAYGSLIPVAAQMAVQMAAKVANVNIDPKKAEKALGELTKEEYK